MPVPPLLKVYCAANVFLFLPFCDTCVVDHVLLVAVVFDGAFVLVSALTVAACFFLVFLASEHLVVVAFYRSGDVFACAVGHFYCVSVEDLSEGAVFGEMQLY